MSWAHTSHVGESLEGCSDGCIVTTNVDLRPPKNEPLPFMSLWDLLVINSSVTAGFVHPLLLL